MTEHRIIRRRRHVARSARILSTGLSATAILGITAGLGAAERARSADQTPGDASQSNAAGIQPTVASEPSALAPLGTPAIAAADSVTQFPATDGTVTLPGAATPGTTKAQSNQNAVVQTAPASLAVIQPQVAPSTAAPVDTTPVATPATAAPVDTAPAATVAPIAPAQPPTQLTLPPAPSRGSSGGSR